MRTEEIKKILKIKINETMTAQGISQAMLGGIVGSERRVINRQLNAENTSIDKLLEFSEALKIQVKISFD